MENKTILVIEDDPMIQKLLKIYLAKAGYHVISAFDGIEGRRLFRNEEPCLIILDLMLPKLDGKALCEEIRGKWKSKIPIIMLSAKSESKDKINGLRIGADDYVTKPFSPEELTERIRAVMRRAGQHCLKIEVDGLVIKPKKKEVWLHGRQVNLTPTEYHILYILMTNENQVISREQLLGQLYPLNEKDTYERTIDVHVKKLRRKIESDPTNPCRVITVRGMGYRFVN